ncbi:Pal1 cell morphology protein-domain-containing protein [Collybia nuda]|uniref:Pal1 cell morphology protein-domain-containing protein n=1 Tax=Collybia nuda TaxID=64659 RepID=A0A9P5Y5T7_9AGAR|nr:Pal1 cell morphology protein-domain-containing protein [Collybia nuda]
MAAVYPNPSSRHPKSRLRSSSDPFVDPATKSQRPPPPPPKTLKPPRMPAPVPKTAPVQRDTQRDITEAVRDTVTVRGSTDYNPRTRVGRSQTAITPSPGSRPPGRRSQSQDSAILAEKAKASGKPRSKKGSQHADVIDRLDFTGVGPMFHHDGPFDACAPSRNRQRNKAPMFAWSARPDESPAHGDSAYPSAHAIKAFSNNYVDPPKKKVDAIAEAWGIHEPEPYEEFFAGGGTGRPDGDTPASSIYNGRDSHNSHSTSRSGAASRRAKDGRDARDVYRDHLEEGQHGNSNTNRPRMTTRRSVVPPPKPIFVPDPSDAADPAGSPPISSPGFPKRSKSLMHRIRKMRDAPNVPAGPDYDQPPSPSSPIEHSYPGADGNSNPTRPTHRTQNSFLGRFGGTRANQTVSEKSEPFVYIDAHNNKDLPAPPQATNEAPGEQPSGEYFDSTAGGGAFPTSPGLGRKTSLMKKVGRVVGRSRP